MKNTKTVEQNAALMLLDIAEHGTGIVHTMDCNQLADIIKHVALATPPPTSVPALGAEEVAREISKLIPNADQLDYDERGFAALIQNYGDRNHAEGWNEAIEALATDAGLECDCGDAGCIPTQRARYIRGLKRAVVS